MGRIGRSAQARISKKPFYIEKADLRIYSSEELGFYIRKNLSAIDRGFFNDDLFRFISVELHNEKLAGKMRARAKSDDVLSMAESLALAVGDLDKREAEQLSRTVNSLRSMTPAGRMKLNADSLMSQGKTEVAYPIYMELIDDHKGLSDEELGKINLSLARILAECFDFEKSQGFYCTAYEYLKDREILHELFDLIMLCGSDDMLSESVFRPLADATIKAWEDEFERKKQNAVKEFELSGPKNLDDVMGTLKDWRGDFRKIHKSCCQKSVFSV